MPRNSGGNYTLPVGNPVIDGTPIMASWANHTLSDIAAQLNNVITRDGLLGFLNPVKAVDGDAATPAYSFAGLPNTGMYRQASSLQFSVGGTYTLGLSASGAELIGDVTLSGTGRRITGDFSNSTLSNRVSFQSSITNGLTAVQSIPNGTGGSASFVAFGSQDANNSNYASLVASPSVVALNSSKTGSASVAPMSIRINDIEAIGITANRNVLIRPPATGTALRITGAPGADPLFAEINDSATRVIEILNHYTGGSGAGAGFRAVSNSNGTHVGTVVMLGNGLYLTTHSADPLVFRTNTTVRYRIDSDGRHVFFAPSAGHVFKAFWGGNDAVTIHGTSTDLRTAIHVGSTTDGLGGIFFYERSTGVGGLATAGTPDGPKTNVIWWDGNRRVHLGPPAIGTALTVNHTPGSNGLEVTSSSGAIRVSSGTGLIPVGGNVWTEGPTDIALGSHGAGHVRVYTNNIERVRFRDAGIVDFVTNVTSLFLNLTDAVGVNRSRIGWNSSNGLVIRNIHGSSLSLGTNDIDRLTINSTGNVTISSPGNSINTLSISGGNVNPLGGIATFALKTTGPSGGGIGLSDSGSNVFGGIYCESGSLFIGTNTTSETTSVVGRLSISNNGICRYIPADSSGFNQEIGFRTVPRVSTTSTPLPVAWRGSCVAFNGTATVQANVFSAGDAISIYNDTASAMTIVQDFGLTLRLAGTTNTGNRTLAARGLATIWFNSPTEAIISGAGLS